MNEEIKKKMPFLIGLGVVLIGVLIWYFMPPSDSGTSGDDKSDTPDNSAATSTGMKFESVIATVDVNIDELVANVASVVWDHSQAPPQRDPMQAVVGSIGGRRTATPLRSSATAQVERMAREMALTGIVWDEYAPLAVIDNEVVRVGHAFPTDFDYPKEILIKSIEKDHVILRVEDTLIPIGLKEQ